MSNGDEDGFVDDPRGNAYQPVGFIKDYVGDTYGFLKTKKNYFFTYKTPVRARLGDNGIALNVRAKTKKGLLVDAKDEVHAITQLYNIYASHLLIRKFNKTKKKGFNKKKCDKYLRKALRSARNELFSKKNKALRDELRRYLR